MLAVALSLLLASAVTVNAHHNEVDLGSAMDYSVNKDSSTCAIKFTVPEAVVKPGCKVRIRYDIPAAEPRQPTVSFFLKKDGNGFFTDADKKPVTNQEFDFDCAAGKYSLGAKVESCAACILGANAIFTVSVVLIQDGNGLVNIGEQQSFYAGTYYLTADKYIIHKFKTTAANQVGHFKIIKSFTSVFDNLAYYAAPGDKTLAEATAMEYELSSTHAADVARRIIVNATTAGEYQFIIKLNSIGNKTELSTQFKLNMEPDDIEYHEARCPQVSCSAADSQGCGACTKNGCNWCGGAENKCVEGDCSVLADLVIATDKCVDIDGECRKFGSDCGKCLMKKGCIYCDTGSTFGFSSGQCSAGEDSLGKDCSTVGETLKLTNKYTEVSSCPSSASTVVASLAALVIAFVSLL